MGEELLRDAPAKSPRVLRSSRTQGACGRRRRDNCGPLKLFPSVPTRSNGSLMSFSVLSTELTDPSPKSS